MFYPFMTLNDNTEIVHSEVIEKTVMNRSKFALKNLFMEGFTQHLVGYLITDGKILMDFLRKKLNISKNI